MKRILLVTSLYPADDIRIKNNTSVCHYFAKEWSRMGYEVRVIHLYNEYPLFFYPVLKLAKNILADRIDAAILDKRENSEHRYTIDGIDVTRMPIHKLMPRGDYSEAEIRRVVQRIYSILQESHFSPDYILGHFVLPGIRIVASLKSYFPDACTTLSLHGKERKVRKTVLKSLPSIDRLGYRSYPIKKAFESLYGEWPFFMCMSGVPVEYITDSTRTFEQGIHHFIYVGNLMQRKYPSCLIPAIAGAYGQEEYTITYVGDGNGVKDVRNEIARCHPSGEVYFKGRLDREEVLKQMDGADVFIMISEKETFGLVYLEAMARGCITVASRDEGMDGVIIDGKNGFLCKAGDSEELGRIVSRIKALDKPALQEISRCARMTAKAMTDSRMAEEYLNGLSR